MLVAIPFSALLRTCVTTQANIIVLGPNRSMIRPRNGEAIAKTIKAIDCTEERVALSQPKSSNIGLKNMLTATELIRKIITHEAATMYQP